MTMTATGRKLREISHVHQPILLGQGRERPASLIGIKLVDWHENYLGFTCFSGQGDKKDDIMWHYDDKGTYTVKSGYLIRHNLASGPTQSIPHPLTSWWTLFWKLWNPLKVKIFIRKACHDWIPTKFNMARRGVQTSGICDACKICNETTLLAL
ncbi:hypothetical protein Ddye_003123 [Dipteronia dyeriana]|uniref:Reverse transcriptase zinc-binding domain-containing protein n=1 Tax=Dipteronia dyeriana TaxID=168575 RepID=A0AAD9XRP8_9ROSI|nr:hypothetical protein Ddye_003123 [Dipteronia dyeriana]